MPIEVTLACSGADALALCLGTILAYPVKWRARIAGAAGGAALILVLNTLRIGTLGQAAASPAWFNILHVYVWPAVLLLAIAGYVFAWMRFADGALRRTRPCAAPATNAAIRRAHGCVSDCLCRVRRRSISKARACSCSRDSSPAAAASILGAVGDHRVRRVQRALDSARRLPRDAGMHFDAAVPVYLAAICAYSTTWRRLILGVLAAMPLFIALGIARLLVVALPGVVVVAAVLRPRVLPVAARRGRRLRRRALAPRRQDRRSRTRRQASSSASCSSICSARLHASGLAPGRRGTRRSTGRDRVPAGIPDRSVSRAVGRGGFAAVGWRRFVAGLAVLGLTQSAGLLALQTLAIHAGVTAHVRDVRGWAVAGPVLDFCRGDHQCPDASLKSSRCRRWPRSSPS